MNSSDPAIVPISRATSAAFDAVLREGASGDLVELVPGQSLEVALYWQHWRVESQALRLLTGAVHAAAAAMLEHG